MNLLTKHLRKMAKYQFLALYKPWQFTLATRTNRLLTTILQESFDDMGKGERNH